MALVLDCTFAGLSVLPFECCEGEDEDFEVDDEDFERDVES